MADVLTYVLHYEGAFNKNSLGAVSEGAARATVTKSCRNNQWRSATRYSCSTGAERGSRITMGIVRFRALRWKNS